MMVDKSSRLCGVTQIYVQPLAAMRFLLDWENLIINIARTT
jgi:hypothetical protein